MTDMKKNILVACLVWLAGVAGVCAQSQVKYGTLHYDSVMKAQPEYADAQARMAELRKQYEDEAAYNETTFRRMFAEFLQGQKDFPQNIMLKRQRDLQDEMEKSLAFRRESDRLLQQAEADMLAPLRKRLDEAVTAVGLEHGYECIVDKSARTHLFLHPSVTEDATPFVLEKLKQTEKP